MRRVIGVNKNRFLIVTSNWDFIILYLQLQNLFDERLKETEVEMQQLSDIEKTDSNQKTSCLIRSRYNVRTKVCVNFKTDTEKVNSAVYRNGNNLFLKSKKLS